MHFLHVSYHYLEDVKHLFIAMTTSISILRIMLPFLLKKALVRVYAKSRAPHSLFPHSTSACIVSHRPIQVSRPILIYRLRPSTLFWRSHITFNVTNCHFISTPPPLVTLTALGRLYSLQPYQRYTSFPVPSFQPTKWQLQLPSYILI